MNSNSFDCTLHHFCSYCGFDITKDDLLIDNFYPLNREKTKWKIICSFDNGGCGRYVLGETEEEVINKWNNNIIEDFCF